MNENNNAKEMAENNISKYLLFTMANESYGISINKIREVIRQMKITKIHDDADFLRGVINLRGKIIPIIDMREKFGITTKEYTDRTIFLIVDVNGENGAYNIGLAVDSVRDVADIPESKMEKASQIGLKLKSKFLFGIANVEDQLVMILDINKVLTTEEEINISQISANTKNMI